jgi:integrase
MALKLKRRHTSECQLDYAKKNPDSKPLPRFGIRPTRCTCPWWVTGTLKTDGMVRVTTKESDFEAARKVAAAWEAAGRIGAPPPEPPADPTDTHTTLDHAIGEFNSGYLDAKGLAKGTKRGYATALKFLKAYAAKKGLRFVDQLDLARLQDWQKGWSLSPRSAGKRLELIRCFFEFCVDRDWLAKNPTKNVNVPTAHVEQKEPFSDEELAAIMEACRTYDRRKIANPEGPRLEAIALLMWKGGLRISDASMFTIDQLDNLDRANYYPIKSNSEGEMHYRMVTVRMPKFVCEKLRAQKLQGGKYLFTTGKASVRTAEGIWQRKFRRIFDRAREIIREQRGDPDWDWASPPTPHRFRHTFAIFMLQHGVEPRDVADLMGHSSEKITLRHYRKWVPGLQNRLDDIVDAAYEAAIKPRIVRRRASNE